MTREREPEYFVPTAKANHYVYVKRSVGLQIGSQVWIAGWIDGVNKSGISGPVVTCLPNE